MSLNAYDIGDMQLNPNDSLMQDILNATDPSMMDEFSDHMLPLDMDLTAMSESDMQNLSHMASPANHQTPTTMPTVTTTDNLNTNSSSSNGEDLHNHLLTGTSSGVGAGPLPASYGVQLAPGAGSTLTEFTKRRNWSQRIIEELKDFLHVLTPDGRIVYASPSAKFLTGHDSQDLMGKFVAEYIHPDDSNVFVREFNESIASGNPLRFFYRFRKPDGTYNIFECHGHPHLASEATPFGASSSASYCRGFFMMARPYPTKNAGLLDSFLEHKIENERLKKRIADLKREEAEDLEGQRQLWMKKEDGGTATGANSETPVPNGGGRSTGTPPDQANSNASPNDYNGMPPPAKPSSSSIALTTSNLNQALAASRPDSINDKMARYEGATHYETIEMLTGLRYRDGERSKGISTGAASPALIRGDAGIPVLVDKDGKPTQGSRGYNSPFGESNDKKKKMKVADEYVCTDCGTLDSPEWRKGPSGPKTLCNACGLRWAKKEKKEKTKNSQNGNGGTEQNNTPSNNATTNNSTPSAANHNTPTTNQTPIAPLPGNAQTDGATAAATAAKSMHHGPIPDRLNFQNPQMPANSELGTTDPMIGIVPSHF